MKLIKLENKEIVYFSSIVLLLSAIICCLAFVLENNNLSILSVFIPTIVALIYTVISKGRKGVYDLFVKQTFKKVKIKWFVISLIGIPFIASLAMLTVLKFDTSEFSLRTTQLMPQFVVIILIALGEEYGWRGFLLPRLMCKFNVFKSSIILGLIWGVWHLPAYLIGTGTPQNMNFIVFLLWVILGTFFISWVYYYSKSVLTSILIHISANTAFNYLLILPEFTGSMNTFWVFLLYLSLIILTVFYIRRKDLLKTASSPFESFEFIT